MVKPVLTRSLLVVALALPLPAAATAQEDDPAPVSLEELGLQLTVQAEQIYRLHERIDDIRIGVLRDRIKTLETSVTELSGAFAAAPFMVAAATEDHE